MRFVTCAAAVGGLMLLAAHDGHTPAQRAPQASAGVQFPNYSIEHDCDHASDVDTQVNCADPWSSASPASSKDFAKRFWRYASEQERAECVSRSISDPYAQYGFGKYHALTKCLRDEHGVQLPYKLPSAEELWWRYGSLLTR